MARKSEIRKNAETALAAGDYPDCLDVSVFRDVSESGVRVKFCINPRPDRLQKMREAFAAMYPAQDTRVWIVTAPPGSYGGVAFKVFN